MRFFYVGAGRTRQNLRRGRYPGKKRIRGKNESRISEECGSTGRSHRQDHGRTRERHPGREGQGGEEFPAFGGKKKSGSPAPDDFEDEDIDFDNIIDENGHLTLRDTDAFNRMLDEEYDEIFKRLGLDSDDL